MTEAADRPDQARLAEGVERAAAASWDSIVLRMRQLIADALAAGLRESVVDGVLDDVRPTETAKRPAVRSRAAETLTFAPGSSSDAT